MVFILFIETLINLKTIILYFEKYHKKNNLNFNITHYNKVYEKKINLIISKKVIKQNKKTVS